MIKLGSLLLALAAFNSQAQDLPYAKGVVTELASQKYWGRGYLYNGMGLAADFIASELKKNRLTPLRGKSYFQDFNYSINTFPGAVAAKLNGIPLRPGIDFLVSADSVGRKGHATLTISNPSAPFKANPDTYTSANKEIIVKIVDKLTWAARQKARMKTTTEIQVLRNQLTMLPKEIELNIENELVESFAAKNLAAVVRGKKFPDQYIVLSAHYDHLGGLSNQAYFPGANDNASGTAFLLNLAKYYQKHPQPYSIAFLFFAGEEAGLVGSKFFTEHPLMELKKIKFLFNFDMVGTGDAGATVVNAAVLPEAFKKLQDANSELRALPRIGARGEAPNSDHYWFYKAGVPSFFLYTEGGIQAYHDVDDVSRTLPFTRYSELFRLVLKFTDKIQL